jgi:benzodiazapine receptor
MHTSHATPTRAWIILGIFLLIVIGVGGAIGFATAPGEWYGGLAKPPFNPPNWVFGTVWFLLYILIAIAGWRTFLAEPRGPAMRLWYAQMGLNWLWTPVFFTLHWLWPAVIIIVALLMTILAYIAVWWNGDRVASWCFIPYAVWVAFASVLNLSIALLN